MKATQSKDGEMRFTLKIAHRVSSDDLINAIGWKIMREYFPIESENKAMAVETILKQFGSRKAILVAVEESIRSEGDSVWTWSDNFTAETAGIIREQGRVLVAKKFPELKKP